MSEPVQTSGMRKRFKPTPHPLLPFPSDAEIAEDIAAIADDPQKLKAYFEGLAQIYNNRELRLRQADETDLEVGDPFRFGFELAHWRDADAELKKPGSKGQYVSGGKRATKTERAAWRVMQAARHLKRGKIWCMQGSERTSISEQQAVIWKYMPREWKALNGKRDPQRIFKINYTPAGGFADRIFVSPDGFEIHFLTYNQDFKEFQGWKLGAPLKDWHREQMAKYPWLHNIGAWADEDMPLDWFNTIQARCSTNDAVWLWTFSTLEGITATIKELLTGAKTQKSLPAEMLQQNIKHVPDCPPGEMPYVVRVNQPGVSVMYFHTRLNPFPPNYENMKAIVADKAPAIIMRDLYGYAEDTRSRAWPKFGGWNVIEADQLPADRTNYMLTDPAGARNWASLWVGVAPGNPPRYYIYRDWPDKRRHGPWAVPSSDPHQPDGDPGSAQNTLGYGWVKYKQMWLREERIVCAQPILEIAAQVISVEEKIDRAAPLLEKYFADPYRRKVVLQAIENEADLTTLQELIRHRYIDPRAGRDKKTTDTRSTCAIDELAKTHRDPVTQELLAPAMNFIAAQGLQIETGIQAVTDLLDWNTEHPDGLVPLVNEPHLYVVNTCEQVIWTLENYTANGGETGGCKDFADLLRYMALARLRYIAPGAVKTLGGGSY